MAKYPVMKTVRISTTLEKRIEIVAEKSELDESQTTRALLEFAVSQHEGGYLNSDMLRRAVEEEGTTNKSK